ncbi:DNA methyltransferase [Streptomyces sp. NA02950]|uniref:type ISP restriction/modification enzyme n=1 Tax=Streptomyces sp. NA02950 TaxID=2742137 RepID=UPI0015908DF2|nr:type ISP restriction/modification enzyme [Streptomyces sp. NA02950]QKV95800.1 DNA methyltransferase [Streptomyces sp. NA02950]
MPGVGERDVPLGDLMPWSVAPLRLGRAWVMAPDAASLTARWERLVAAGDTAERAALFRPSRARSLHTSVAQLPGQRTSTARLVRAGGPCPEPVRVAYGPFDQQWLIPDHRLIDAARPELWRVADDQQIHVVEAAAGPDPEPVLTFSAVLPDGWSAAGRPGRIRPLYRRPGGREPNVAPGLLDHLGARLGHPVSAADLLAWTAATAHSAPCAVPLTADPEVWAQGVELGRRALWLHTRGAHSGERPRMPGGQRPYVRAPLPARGLPDSLDYDPETAALCLGEGRISPVPRGAWEFPAHGVRVLESWFERRTARGEPGTLEAVVPGVWPSAWTSELLELITVLALLAELRPHRRDLATRLLDSPLIAAAELREAGVLPVPAAARRPASVLDHHEEGPEGQFALV